MVRQVFALMLAALLTVAFTSVTFSDDPQKAEKKEAPKEAKMAIKSVSCDPDCGFMVRSHDEMEIVNIVKMHAKAHHNKDVTDDEVRGMMKTKEMKEGMPKHDMKEMKDKTN